MDVRLAQARALQHQIAEHRHAEERLLERRNALIRALAADRYGHQRIADALGLTVYAVASIVMGRTGPGTRGRRRAGG